MVLVYKFKPLNFKVRRPSGDSRWQELQTRPDPTNVCRGIVREAVMPSPEEEPRCIDLIPDLPEPDPGLERCDTIPPEMSFDLLSHHWERLARYLKNRI